MNIRFGFLVLYFFILKEACYSVKAEGWTEQWDYVGVRPGAHMFYWLYHTTSSRGSLKAPLILWLQGGPGQSSTGMGNFEEIGPLDISLQKRNTTWLSEASLLFVDSPVGSGYSYVEDDELYCNSTEMIARDMITFLTVFFSSTNGEIFKQVPFYIMTESYGGKMTAVIAEQLLQAISNKRLICNFVGITLGAPFIHPEVTVQSWMNYTLSNALIDQTEEEALVKIYRKLKKFTANGSWDLAFKSMMELGGQLQKYTNYVNLYNFLQWDPRGSKVLGKGILHASSNENALWALMNGDIRRKLEIIPKSVTWGGQNESVYSSLNGDFMKPVVNTVNKLVLASNLRVAVYTGQLDIIVNTLGTLKWVSSLKIYSEYSKTKREPFACSGTSNTCGFVKTYKNFSFFWIMNAGHMVPKDNGDAALEMVKQILDLNQT